MTAAVTCSCNPTPQLLRDHAVSDVYEPGSTFKLVTYASALDQHIVKPDDNYADASDPQTWLLGRVNRLYSSTGVSQPIQNYSGKVGFIND